MLRATSSRRRTWITALALSVVASTLVPVAAAPDASAARGEQVRPITFPATGKVTYRDDFGECRGGSTCPRSHEGNDLIGERMVPLVAAADGTIDWFRVDDGKVISGNALSIKDADGWRYVYVHLNNDTPGTDDGLNPLEHAFAPGIELGAKVTAGQLIGWLGDSGNAEGSVPHLHFEVRMPDGKGSTVAISPYNSLRAAQGLPVSASQCDGSLNPTYTAPKTTGPFGYWVLGRDGGIFAFGDAGFFGSTGAMRLNRPVVGMAPTATGKGYWLVATDGGIFAFGDAGFFGSTGAMRLNKPVVGMAPTGTGKGYWLVASDGGVFAFGDAPFLGSAGAAPPPSPVVTMVGTPAGDGYWLLTEDGTVLPYGGAAALGSLADLRDVEAADADAGDADDPKATPEAVTGKAVGIAPTASGKGYWVLTADGALHAFGDAEDLGSPDREGLCKPPSAVALRGTASGRGYAVATADGAVYVYGDAKWVSDLPARSIKPNQAVLGVTVFDRRTASK
jgi:hypothetical protein